MTLIIIIKYNHNIWNNLIELVMKCSSWRVGEIVAGMKETKNARKWHNRQRNKKEEKFT